MTTPADPRDVIYRQLMHWPLPPVQVADDIIAALDAAGYDIVARDPRPATCPTCPTCGSDDRDWVVDCTDPVDPWHGEGR